MESRGGISNGLLGIEGIFEGGAIIYKIEKFLSKKKQIEMLMNILSGSNLGKYKISIQHSTARSLVKGKKRLLFWHIFQSSLFNLLLSQEKFPLHYKREFEMLFKKENDYRLTLPEEINSFYRDVVIDRIPTEATSEMQTEIRKALELCDEFCKKYQDVNQLCNAGINFEKYVISTKRKY